MVPSNGCLGNLCLHPGFCLKPLFRLHTRRGHVHLHVPCAATPQVHFKLNTTASYPDLLLWTTVAQVALAFSHFLGLEAWSCPLSVPPSSHVPSLTGAFQVMHVSGWCILVMSLCLCSETRTRGGCIYGCLFNLLLCLPCCVSHITGAW